MNGLLDQHKAAPGRCAHCEGDDDMPEDIDEFRRALAYRIDAFVASRMAAEAAAEAAAAAAAAEGGETQGGPGAEGL